MDKEKINDAIMILAKAHQNPRGGDREVERAITILRTAMSEGKEYSFVKGSVKMDPAEFFPLGVPWFDTWTHGIRRKEQILFGAVPKGGKTHLLGWFGGQGLLEGAVVLDIFGEDLIEDKQGIYAKTIEVAGGNKKALDNLWLLEMHDREFTTFTVEDAIMTFKEKNKVKPDIVVIDHLDLMTAGGYAREDWQAAAASSKGLKQIAKRQDVVIATATQLNFGDAPGMQRLYRAKVGKASNADIVILVDDVQGDYYTVSLEARRGARVVQKTKTISCNWDTMEVREVV